ncbi:MAG: fibronectin type III domain-containing protein [Candidatus Micrarchaeia archaeon]
MAHRRAARARAVHKARRARRTRAFRRREKVFPWLALALAVVAIAALGALLLKPRIEEARAPEPPTGAVARADNKSILVAWSPSKSAAGYAVYRSLAVGELGARVAVVPANQTWFRDASTAEGALHYYAVFALDALGRQSAASANASILADYTPPEALEVSINGGEPYARSKKVTLSLYASGAAACRLSQNGVWGPFEPYAGSREFELAPGDGVKRIFFQCVDEAGNEAAPASASIILDENAPSVAIISPVAGEAFPAVFNASFSADDAVSAALWCNATVDGEVGWSGRVERGAATQHEVRAGYGEHVYVVECQDEAGWAGRAVVRFNATAPAARYGPPLKPEIIINNGAPYANTSVVAVYVRAAGASECRVWNEGEPKAEAAWEPFVPIRVWQLTGGDGFKTVFAECRNAYGSSPAGSDAIYVDTVRPSPVQDLIASAAPGGSIRLSWSSVRDGPIDGMGSGVAGYEIYRARMPFYSYERIGFANTTAFSDESAVNGERYSYRVYALDRAGSLGLEGNAAEATSDADAPSVVAYSPVAGASYFGGVPLAFSASDALSRTLWCQYELDGRAHYIGEVVSGSASNATLNVAVGPHSIRIVCRDGAGNAGEAKAISFNALQYA